MRGIIGPERIDREPEAAREIAAQCAELPLAIRIAGGILVANPHLTLVQLAQRLTSGDVLSKLSVGGLDLRDRLAGNWQSLEPGLQGVLRKASAMPDDFSSAMIARELGNDQSTASLRLDETIEALDRLSATSLLDVVDRGAPGEPVHYRVNGLMRAWMAEGGRRVTSVPAEQFRTEPLDRKGTAARVTHRLLHHRIRPVDGRLVLLPRGCSG